MYKQYIHSLIFKLLELDRSIESIYAQKKFLNYVHHYSAAVQISEAQSKLDAEIYKISTEFAEIRNTLRDFFSDPNSKLLD
jgi:hypothetical protein